MSDAIRLERLTKKLGERQILRELSLAVSPGDIFGYLGPNGAGKTTTIRMILGLFAPTSGSVNLLGRDPREEGVREKVGFVLEADGLYDNLSAADNLTYYGRLYGVHGLAEKLPGALRSAGLSDRAGDKVGTFSKGMRQRLALARALLHEPEVVILDEPTAGLDPAGQVEIRQTLLELANREGKTVFLSSHNLDEVQRICNRIAIIHEGRIKLDGNLRDLESSLTRGGVIVETAQPLSGELLADLTRATGATVTTQNATSITLSGPREVDIPQVVSLIAAGGAEIEMVRRRKASLEDMYLDIVHEAEGEA